MKAYETLGIVEGLPDALHPVTDEDAQLRQLRGATIVRIGSTNDAKIEGGGLLIDYVPANDTRVRRAVFAFNDLGLWMEWTGLIPMKENA
jgi:hypothetical protein